LSLSSDILVVSKFAFKSKCSSCRYITALPSLVKLRNLRELSADKNQISSLRTVGGCTS
jgi:hypothetical protein